MLLLPYLKEGVSEAYLLMKDQASLNLLIVDSPIDNKALENHLMLRATSEGLRLYNNTGAETPIGGEVDETRLLPTGAKDGDLPIKSAEIVGNDYNDGHTVLFIQGSAANAAAADSPLPVTWNNQPSVQEDNTLLLTGSTQLSTASAPEVKRVFGGEFTVEAYLKPTQFNNTSRQDTNFFYLNGPSTYYIYLSNYNNSGNAENGKFGLWVYSGNRQITLNNEEFHHVALDVYMEGTTRKYTIYYDGVAVQTDTWYNDGVADSTNAIIRFFSSSDEAELNNCYLKSIRVSDIARYKGKSFTPPANGLYLPAPDGEWITINRSNFVEQTDHKLNPEPTTVDETKYGFSPALKKDAETETFAYEMPSKANDVPTDSTLQLNNSGTPVFVEAEKVLLSDAKSTKLNQLDVARQLPASPADNVTPVYKKQDVIGAMYNDSKTVVLLQGSKTNIAKNATFQLTGGDEVTVDSDGNLVFNRGNGIIVPAGKFNNEANGQFTIDIMVAVDQLPSSTGSYEYILGNDNSPIYPFNYRVFGDGTVRFQYQNTSHHIQIEQGIFTLLSFDYDGTTLRSYKDGVLVGAQDMTYSAFPNSIGIGTDQYYSHTGFAGRIKYIRMSNIARYRGQAFTAPGLAGYVTPPDGEWVTMPAIGDNRLLPNNPTNGDIPCYNATATTGGGNDVNTKVLLHFDELPFADTAAGNASPAAVTNSGVTLDTENFKFGTASAKFANSSNNLKVAVPQAQMMASPWLADCWFKVDDGQWREYRRIFTQDDEQNGGWTYYLMSGNRVGVWVRNVTPDEPASAALTPGDWHYAALVYHDSKFYGFIDGVRFTVQDGSAEGFLNYIMLGKRIQSTSYSLRGNIDEFRFQLLDEAEIGKWTGTTIPVPTTPYSIQETAGEWGKFNKSELVKSVNGATPDSSGVVTLQEATTSAAGLMAAADKTKLDKFGESDGKLTYGGAEIGGGGISEIAVGTGLSGTGITSDPLNLNIANYTSQSTISLSSTEGSVNLAGYNSVNLQETFGNKLTLAERGIVITTASGADVLLNEHASNSPSGFVILDSTGKLPALDGSKLTNLPTGAVDLSAYTGGINLNSTNDSAVAIKFNSGNPTYNAALTMDAAGVTLSGYGDVTLQHTGGSYLRLTSGEATLSSNSSLTLSASSRLTISAKEGIYLGGAGLNTAGGLVKVGDDGKIPSSLYDAGTGGDTSALETRVTTLETTVGTLNTTVDEILADYGEGSGALVYRVVASATEPEHPTEGMLWIKTE